MIDLVFLISKKVIAGHHTIDIQMGNAQEIRATGYDTIIIIGPGASVPETGQHDARHVLNRSRYVDIAIQPPCPGLPPTSPSTPDDPDDQEM